MNEKIQFNPELLKTIEDHFDDVDDREDALMLCTCVFLNNIEFLYRREIIKTKSDEDALFHKFRILFMEKDVDVDSLQSKYNLRVPLFVTDVEDDVWDEFYKWLVKNPRLSQYRGRFSQTMDGKKAFEELQSIKGFDIGRFKSATETYYVREGQYAKALPKFLIENARGEYEGFREVKSKMI